MLHAQHNKIMAKIGLADDKAGTALHIFRSTGNLMLEIEGAEKEKVSSGGRWTPSTKGIYYDDKSSLHNLPVKMLLASWGDNYKKEFFLGRSTVSLPLEVLAEFASHLRPSIAETETKVANKLKELNALPRKEKQWQCNQKVRTYLADMQTSVQAERRLFQVFLYGLPLLVAQYIAERLVVVRGISLAELRDAVNFAEPVPNSRAKGGRPASRKDNDTMPRDNIKTLVTKGQILLWRAEALQVELSQVGVKADLEL